MMEQIEWEDPPEGRAAKTASWRAKARILRDNPGRWAIVHRTGTATAASTFASHLRQGKTSSFGPGFDAAVKGTIVYARFVGDKA